MIKIENKANKVVLFEDEDNNSLEYNGKQLIQLKEDLVIPAHTRIEYETGLHLTLTDAIDECIVGEYIEDEDSGESIEIELFSYTVNTIEN